LFFLKHFTFFLVIIFNIEQSLEELHLWYDSGLTMDMW